MSVIAAGIVVTILILAAPALASNDYPSSLATPAKDSVVDPWGFFNRECTSFVAWRMNRDGGEGTFTNGMQKGHWGNATEWAGNAEHLGFPVNSTPAVGAIAQWDAGEDGVSGDGHVAYVSAVNSDGSVDVEEYNVNEDGNYHVVNNTRAPRYIHIHDQSSPPPPPPNHALSDFNGDGLSDIAWYSNGNIVGLLSESGRAFRHWEALAGPTVGQSELGPPEWAGVGDFNGDGISDIAWYSNGNIVGLLSESGRALKHWEYLAGPMVGQSELGPPEWAGVGNYNGDGISDIAWYSNGNIVGLLSESGRALKHWEYLAGPVVGQSELGPPEWAGQGDFPYTNGGNARRVDFTASSPYAATLGQPYSYAFAASGTPAPTFSIASGALPPGTTLSRNGVLSGTPTKVGSYQVSVKATNSEIGPGTFTGTLTLVVATTPTVAKLNPRKAGPEGGVSVQITGTGFATGAIVKFGATVASSITVNSSTSITAVAPPGTSGPVEVSVTSQGGTSKLSTKDRFTYGPPVVASVSADHGSKAGGTRVTIEGSGFSTRGTSFTFGKASGTEIECASTGSCSVVVPAAAKAGVVDVVAVVGKSKSKKNRPVDQYVYE
ncbi:MAG TPA: CHAP domain-containing protein [Solirubrobacteraceae bacterium]|nr:CHAP domain-containing protein [Solirubrobacteraceae bacterium]